MRFLPSFRNGHGAEGPPLPFYLGRFFSRFSPEAEEYRSLRTAIELTLHGREAKTFLVTSPGPGEGKSTLVANLGLLFWEFGRNVLLVDCDLRMPSLHKIFGLRNAKGLTDLLVGNADPLTLPIKLKDGFAVVPRGGAASHPSVLLRSLAFRKVLALYREQADVILMDSSPLLAVSDVIQIVPASDAVILVVQAGQTQRRDVVKAKRLLAAARASLLGTVLNQVEPADGPSYYRGGRYRNYFYDGHVTRDVMIRRAGPEPSGPAGGAGPSGP